MYLYLNVDKFIFLLIPYDQSWMVQALTHVASLWVGQGDYWVLKIMYLQ